MKSYQRFFLLSCTTILLISCAEFSPREGMNYRELDRMSINSFNGSLVFINKENEFEIYQLYSTVSKKQLRANHFIERVLNRDVDNRYYIFKAGYLVKIAKGEYELNDYIRRSLEVKAKGFNNLVEFDTAKSVDEKYINKTEPTKLKPLNLTESDIAEEKKKLEDERRLLAEERRKLEEEKRKLNTKPHVNNAQDVKRQRCINLGLAPNSADFQQCIN